MKKYLLIIGFCLFPLLVHGGVYQWVDKDGRVHFGNIPPQQQGEYKAGEIKHHSSPISLKKEQSKTGLAEDEGAKQELSQENSASPPMVKPAANLSPASKISPKNQNTKFQDRKKLKVLIEHLKEKVKPSHVMKTTSAIEKQPPAPIKAQTLPPEAVGTVKAVDVKAGSGNELVANDKKVSSPENEDSSNPLADENKSVMAQKDGEKCGVFTGFVNSYEIKVAEECPGPHCSVYTRNLKKYKIKQQRYC